MRKLILGTDWCADCDDVVAVRLLARMHKAGKWDEEGGKEYNFCRTERTRIASNVICRLCPVPITFLGWEIGCDVITGGLAPDDDVMRIALMDHGSGSGRMSWDPMTAMLAVIGNEKEAGYDTVRGTASVDVTDGANHFEESVDGPHLYVKKVCENEFYQKMINDIVS